MKTDQQGRLRTLDFVRVPPGRAARLDRRDTAWKGTEKMKGLSETDLMKNALDYLEERRRELAQLQETLFADDRYAVLIVFQALDAAGKDGTIKHVMSGVNPTGCQVFSFKAPSAEEIDHNFLWRYAKALPERGRIGIFNRSYYEEVLVVRVHPEILARQRLPVRTTGREFWKQRFEDINAFERHLARNGTVILKFFLHVSKEAQRRRFLDRLQQPDKRWKFSMSDLEERRRWDDYMVAFEDAITNTSTPWAPWYVIPADHKWVMRAVASQIIVERLESLDLRTPQPADETKAAIEAALKELKAKSR